MNHDNNIFTEIFFIEYSYCPLIHGVTINILSQNLIAWKAFANVHVDRSKYFENLLRKNSSFMILERNI